MGTLLTSDGGKTFPLYITHLTTLHGTPLRTIAVDDSCSGNSYVLLLRSSDTGIAAGGLPVRVNKKALVGRKKNNGILLDMQLHIALHEDRTCQPHALRHKQSASAFFGQGRNSLLESIRIEKQPVTYPTKVFDIHLILGDDNGRYFCHLNGQILIITVILVGSKATRKGHQQKQKTAQMICLIVHCFYGFVIALLHILQIYAFPYMIPNILHDYY